MTKRSTGRHCCREKAVGESFCRMFGKVASEFPGRRRTALCSLGRGAALWHGASRIIGCGEKVRW